VVRDELAGTDAVSRALEERLAWLETLLGMLSEARVVLPAAEGCGEWRGLAQRRYGEALAGIRSQLFRADADTREAIRQIRHALSTLDRLG
jgi:hypothetical protein